MNLNVRMTVKQTFGAVERQTTFTETLPDDFKLNTAFALGDLADKGTDDNIHAVWNDDVKRHCAMLETFSDMVGGIKIESWYRSPSTNRARGSASNSLHLKALATDIEAESMTEAKAQYLVDAWREVCKAHKVIGAIKVYPDKVHLSSYESVFGATDFVVEYHV